MARPPIRHRQEFNKPSPRAVKRCDECGSMVDQGHQCPDAGKTDSQKLAEARIQRDLSRANAAATAQRMLDLRIRLNQTIEALVELNRKGAIWAGYTWICHQCEKEPEQDEPGADDPQATDHQFMDSVIHDHDCPYRWIHEI